MLSRTPPVRMQHVDIPRARSAKVRAQLERFDPAVRPAIVALAASHPYFDDLALTFPAALFAIATRGEGGDTRTAEASGLVRAGAPLRAVARVLDLPMWLRKLPPQAFLSPIAALPAGAEFAFRIANLLPARAKSARHWLACVAAAFAAGDETFALWAAREAELFKTADGPDALRVLGLYAWYSGRPELEAARYITRPWVADMPAEDACRAARRWFEAIDFAIFAVHRKSKTGHVPPAQDQDGIEFIALESLPALREEGAAMSHCIASYAWNAARGCSIIWSLREGGTRVATLELRLPQESHGLPRIQALLGPHNQPACERIWRAVYGWLLAWPVRPVPISACGCRRSPSRAVWRRLWKPYWLAKGRPPDMAFAPVGSPLSNAVWKMESCLVKRTRK